MNTLETKLNKLNAQLRATHGNRAKAKLVIKILAVEAAIEQLQKNVIVLKSKQKRKQEKIMTCYIVISKPHEEQTSWMVEGYIHAKNKSQAISEAIQYLSTDHIAVYPYVRLDEEAQMDAVQRGNLKKRYGGLTYQQMCPEYPEQSCA